jgi:hypothetical protein
MMSYEQYVDTLKSHKASKEKLEAIVKEMSKLLTFADRLIDGFVINAVDGIGVQWPTTDYTASNMYESRPVNLALEEITVTRLIDIPSMDDLVIAINEYHDSIENARHAYEGLDDSEFAVKCPNFPLIHTTAKVNETVSESEA